VFNPSFVATVLVILFETPNRLLEGHPITLFTNPTSVFDTDVLLARLRVPIKILLLQDCDISFLNPKSAFDKTELVVVFEIPIIVLDVDVVAEPFPSPRITLYAVDVAVLEEPIIRLNCDDPETLLERPNT
jgi:hypothetical protein